MPDDILAPMRRALALAERAVGLSDPNPRVGCVIVGADGSPLGEGHTQAAGQAHAEVMALRDVAARGHDARGATAFITLEPCSHHGRTPPCADALVDAGIARAVVAVGDPNPLVAGQGLERLRAAGVQVDMADEAAAEASRELNIGFFSRMARGRPWVRLKIAASLDGRTALADGTSQWITGESARRDGHAWRKRAGAVLTGVGTVLDDDPRLDVRLVETAHQPTRVIVDSRLQTPPGARILQPPGRVLVYGAAREDAASAALQAAGAEVVWLPGPSGKVDLRALLGRPGGSPRERAARGGRPQAQRLAAARETRRRAGRVPGAEDAGPRSRDGHFRGAVARCGAPARRPRRFDDGRQTCASSRGCGRC